jgi:hypothetical protein
MPGSRTEGRGQLDATTKFAATPDEPRVPTEDDTEDGGGSAEAGFAAEDGGAEFSSFLLQIVTDEAEASMLS